MKKLLAFFIVVAILLLAVYHALIYYDNNFRYGRMRETPAVRPYEEPLLIKEAGLRAHVTCVDPQQLSPRFAVKRFLSGGDLAVKLAAQGTFGTAFENRFIHGTQVIAERLGVPTGTVKSRLYYAMRSLRGALEERGILR